MDVQASQGARSAHPRPILARMVRGTAPQGLDRVFRGMRYQTLLEAKYGDLLKKSESSNPAVSVPAALQLVKELNALNQKESGGMDVDLCRAKNNVLTRLGEVLRQIELESPEFEMKYQAVLKLIELGERGTLIHLAKEDPVTRALLCEHFTHNDKRLLAEYVKGEEDPGVLHRVRNRLGVLRGGEGSEPRD